MSKNLHHANLWIGPEDNLISQAIELIQHTLCPDNGCGACVDCRLLAERQHHALTWLVPENYYTVKQIETIFSTVCFALNPGQHHFIVLQRADLLTIASANSLLKALEEPPEGYHYILLAPRTEGILPTIRSRCVVEHKASHEPVTHRLVPYFTQYQYTNGAELMKEIEKARVPERDIDQLLDACMHYWHAQRTESIQAGDVHKERQAGRACDLITSLRAQPPMPGSSKLFLKNLYLRLTLALS